MLAEVLDSLSKQTAGGDLFEIIVVDNNSPDETRTLVDSYADREPIVRYVLEENQGLNYARNAGYESAQSDWVMYLDDDIRAHEDLVERALFVIDQFSFDCFGGFCLPWFKDGRPRWLHDRYVINDVKPPGTTGILHEGYAMGALIVFKKSVLESLGGFAVEHERFVGMKKDKIAYGDETMLQVKMRKGGYTVGFDPELRVDHLVQKSRLHWTWFLKVRFAKGRDAWDTFELSPTIWLLLMRLVFLVVKPLLTIPNNLRQLFTRRDYYFTNFVLDTLYPAALLLGEIYGGLSILGARCKNKVGFH